MKIKSLQTDLIIIEGKANLDETTQKLVEAADDALKISYAPYSKFQVGAALQFTDGTIVKGANFENASYPLCLCAERSAIAAARSVDPNAVIKTMAITARNANGELQFTVTPCGACRQVLSEVEQLQGHSIKLILNGKKDTYWILESASALLPLAFDGGFLQ